MVERCLDTLKNARRLATRYDETADNYLGFTHLVAIQLWLRDFVSASWFVTSHRMFYFSQLS